MSTVTYKAPKVLTLAGEYGMVYGKPVLLCAYESMDSVTVSQTAPSNIKKIIEKIITVLESRRLVYVRKPISIVNPDPSFFDIKTAPIHQITALVAGALHLLLGTKPSPEIILASVKKIVGGRGMNMHSIKAVVCVYGGLVYFRKEFEFLPYTTLLPFKIPLDFQKKLYVITDNATTSTIDEKSIIGMFRANAKKARQLLNDLERLTKQMTVSLTKEDIIFFQNTIDKTQSIFTAMKIVKQKQRSIVAFLSRLGSVKISGEQSIHYILFSNKAIDYTAFHTKKLEITQPVFVYKGVEQTKTMI